jgi:amino acid transporter
MGIPYSKQINAAFDQVTPLVASAFEVLQTTKNIAILLVVIQVCTVILLLLILLALIGLLFTMNPDLETERRILVTPAMQWLASWTIEASEKRKSFIGGLSLVLAIVGFVVWVRICYVRKAEEVEEDASKDDSGKKGEDFDAIKKGDTKQ